VTAPPVRVRFAPSPTGYLHLGSARAALFNWLFARHHGGEMLLRIEDTDAERSRPELIDVIIQVLEWLGLDWDGEPVHQSGRTELYEAAVQRLLASGHAYWCSCTPDEVQARAKERGGRPGYDRHCRDRDLAAGPGRVVRFAVPDEGDTAFDDVVRGHVSFANGDLEDFVIQRSSGTPMFLLANAVDDVELGITHVIRGEDLINTTPKVLLLRVALGTTTLPTFAHLPLIVNEKRQKLSKRRDDVSVGDYIERGYLPEAMSNYLATLGWGAPDGIEIRPMLEIVELFRLEDVTSAGAFFDVKKLDAFNGEWIRRLSPDEFTTRATRWLVEDPPWKPDSFRAADFEAMVPVVQERVTTLAEVPSWVDFVFLDEPEVDDASWEKVMVKGVDAARTMLDGAAAAFAGCGWTPEVIGEALWAVAGEHEIGKKKAQAPVRVAVTGRQVGPPLFESLAVLGRERTLARIAAARSRLPES
jgi:glutamyl-tRNA synthetase